MFQKAEMVKYANIVERLFDCRCSIYELRAYKEGNVTKHSAVAVMENVPCRRSYSTGSNINYIRAGENKGDYIETKEYVKLFLGRNTDIKPGSRIRVECNGRYEYYKYSGYAIYYNTHTEVLLKADKEWA